MNYYLIKLIFNEEAYITKWFTEGSSIKITKNDNKQGKTLWSYMNLRPKVSCSFSPLYYVFCYISSFKTNDYLVSTLAYWMCVNYSFQYQHLVAEQIRDKNKKTLTWLFIVLTYRQNCQNKCLANLDDRQPTKDNYSTHWVKYPVVSITYLLSHIDPVKPGRQWQKKCKLSAGGASSCNLSRFS